MGEQKVLITGITGQDGSYLAELLLEKRFKVYGVVRRSSGNSLSRIVHLKDRITLLGGDLLDQGSLDNVVRMVQPDYIYNLAAQSFVPTSWTEPTLTAEYTALGVLRVLEAMRKYAPEARFYQASSSEMFGKVRATPQNENTPFYPRSPYGVAKTFGHYITVNYRESFNLFACAGILFNHESKRRGIEFVTRKISNSVAKLKHNKLDVLELGNLDSKRDWGHAYDYMKGAYLMLQQDAPDDYVLSSGETHTIREFCTLAFNAIDWNIKWENEGLNEVGLVNGDVKVKVSSNFFRPAEVELLLGDSTKAKEKLNWKPLISFSSLITEMVYNDLDIEGKN